MARFSKIEVLAAMKETGMYKWLDYIGQTLHISSLRFEDFNLKLVNYELTGQFMVHLNIAFWLGLILSIPYICYQLWCFVSPALYPNERRPIVWTFISGGLLFFLGVLISYSLIFPIAIRFFFTYQVSPDIVNMLYWALRNLHKFANTSSRSLLIFWLLLMMSLIVNRKVKSDSAKQFRFVRSQNII